MSNSTEILALCCACVMGIVMIATTSIGIQCYNANDGAYKTEMVKHQTSSGNFGFLIAGLVIAILGICGVSGYVAYKINNYNMNI